MHKLPRIVATLELDGRAIEARMLALLQALQAHRSLAAAARAAKVGYRHAWGQLGRIEKALGAPAVAMRRGSGANLTPLGLALLEIQHALEQALESGWPALQRALQEQPSQSKRPALPPLRVTASHDLALASLREVAVERGAAVELLFQGSTDALHCLARNECDMAGFHVTLMPKRAAGLGPLARLLRATTLRLIPFAIRSQGLMVRPAQAHRKTPLIRRLADITRHNARFVNRQRASGTRLLFDRLLAIEGIAPERIRGYRDEEFTHAAVAATIASGKADVGFGIEAAAREHNLEFIPMASEHYLLAAHAAQLEKPSAVAFIRLLESAEFGRILASLPGYTAPLNHTARKVAETFGQTGSAFR